MKNKKNLYIIIFIAIFLAVGIIIYNYFIYGNKFVKLNYNEIVDKVDNKDSFVLCVTAAECIHCNEYKPKLKKITNQYDINIYYTDIDAFSDAEYSEFKNRFSFDGGTPVTIFFKDGEEATTATRIEGNISNEKIISKLKKNGFIDE